MNDFINLLSLALLGSVIALIGGVVFLFNKRLSSFMEKYSVPFAAGVLVTVSLLGLIPEAEHEIGESAFLTVLLAFIGVYLFEHIFFGIHHHDGEHSDIKQSSTSLVIVGDTIHNFIDGIAIAVSYFVSPGLGLITALSTFLHEIPHEIGDFGILLKAGWKNKKIIVVNVMSALMTVVGAFSVYLFDENKVLTGQFMAVSAGIFLYLGASDFLPRIEKENGNKLKNLLPLILGCGIIIATILLVPHQG